MPKVKESTTAGSNASRTAACLAGSRGSLARAAGLVPPGTKCMHGGKYQTPRCFRESALGAPSRLRRGRWLAAPHGITDWRSLDGWFVVAASIVSCRRVACACLGQGGWRSRQDLTDKEDISPLPRVAAGNTQMGAQQRCDRQQIRPDLQ